MRQPVDQTKRRADEDAVSGVACSSAANMTPDPTTAESGPLDLRASILINNYNYGQFLRRCIDSALAQTYANTEVIVVDDGSNDDSATIIGSYGDSVAAVFKANGGQASCFNAGFARARGDIVFLLDSDDEFHPNKVATILHIYRSMHIEWCFDRADLSEMPPAPCVDLAADITACDLRASMSKSHVPHLPSPTSGLSFDRKLLRKILPMPTAPGITLSDNYLKFAAAGLGAGAICNSPLTYQRIHGRNRYTQARALRRRRADIMMETGIELARNFPHLSGVGVRLTSNALAERVACRTGTYWSGVDRCWRGPFDEVQTLNIWARSLAKVCLNYMRSRPAIYCNDLGSGS